MTVDIMQAMFNLLRTVFDSEYRLTEEDRGIIMEYLEDIYLVAKRNDLAHLVGYALGAQGMIVAGDKLFSEFQRLQFFAIERQERQEHELECICEVLENAKIDHIPLKGAVIKHSYPEPWMRTSCDIDILVRKDDIEAARMSLVSELGYRIDKSSYHDESFDSPSGVHVELHFDLLEEQECASASQVISSVWEYSKTVCGREHVYEMSDGFYYLYHIVHTAKHVASSGIGMRPFLDLYLLEASAGKDESERDELISASGLEKFRNVVRDVALHWMCGKELDESGERVELFILNCGTYGSIKNSVIVSKERNGRSTATKYLFKRIFMPYAQIREMYPILKRHKWLTGFYQIIRWFKILSPKKARRAMGEIRSVGEISESDLKERREILTDMGL